MPTRDSGEALFELAKQLVALHRGSAEGRVTVVPVLVEELAKALPVFRAVAAVTEGKLLVALDQELQTPVPGTTDPVRRAGIRQALVPEGDEGRSVNLVDLEGGMVDAEFVNPPAGPVPSVGEQTVLGVVRAAAHRDLDDHALVVVAYPAGPVDRPFQEALWRLAVEQLAEAPNTTLRTLIVVTEAPISVLDHCQSGRGFRFGFDSGRLVRRHGAQDLRVSAKAIRKRSSPMVFFLGAGFAASTRLPMGDELRDSAIRRILDIPAQEIIPPSDLAREFYQWISERPERLTISERGMTPVEFIEGLTLEQVVRVEAAIHGEPHTLREFRDAHDMVVADPGRAVVDFCEMLESSSQRIVVVELNFDLLLETHATAPLKVFANDSEFEEASDYVRAYLASEESEIPLLKLHGTISDFDSCIVSEEQTERGIGASKQRALRALLDEDKPRMWVYVGASLRDRDIVPVLANEEFARGLDERWVSPYLVESVERFAAAREPYWGHTELPTIYDRLTTETADAFFGALRVAMEHDA